MCTHTLNYVYHIVSLMKVQIAQSCPTLCNPMNYIVHGILQARILEWVATPYFRGSSQPRNRTQVSHIAGRFFTSWATREAQGKTYESGIGIHISPPFWTSSQLPPPPTLLGWYRAPVWVSWATQQITVVYLFYEASFITQLVKNLPAMQETLVWFLGREDPLEKG